jgi:hypothetical protein
MFDVFVAGLVPGIYKMRGKKKKNDAAGTHSKDDPRPKVKDETRPDVVRVSATVSVSAHNYSFSN